MCEGQGQIEQRLDAWGADGGVVDGGDGQSQSAAFLHEVGRVRTRRARWQAGVGVMTVALATSMVWIALPDAPRAAHQPVAGADAVRTMLLGGRDAGEWSLGSLSRGVRDGARGEDLLPGGWSMGWASRPPM